MENAGRIVALDVGERRIGIAVSDPLSITAQGQPTLERQNRAADLAALERIARQYSAVKWLIGLPLHLSGREGRQAERIRQFGARLAEHTRLPVEYWDERLTTVEANRVLREADASLAQRRAAVDRIAAVLLLQSYLDSRSAQRGGAGEADEGS